MNRVKNLAVLDALRSCRREFHYPLKGGEAILTGFMVEVE